MTTTPDEAFDADPSTDDIEPTLTGGPAPTSDHQDDV